MDHYIAAKSKILDGTSHGIISIDDEISKNIANAHHDATRLSVYDELPFNQSHFPRMKGAHNLQNLLAAYHACIALGIDRDIIIERMKSFDGLPHRQYLVRVINGVPYVNDSKATNAEALKQALRAYRNIILIAGGVPKDGCLDGIDNDLGEVKKAYLFGAARNNFAEFLTTRGIDVEMGEALDDVLPNAHEYAQELRGEPSGAPTVLFSPACASFDQYDNFEQRGEHFCDLVNGLDDA
jgi:UDP-N-acetylmuramoylalanine--D-glutamate ligase